MFYYLWKSLPYSAAIKAVIFTVAIVCILAIVFFGVFPVIADWITPDTIVYRN